jgi:micrococcal nuclease
VEPLRDTPAVQEERRTGPADRRRSAFRQATEAMGAPCYRYRATLNRVIDGDTYLLDLDLGFRVHAAVRIRLRGYDAPELHAADILIRQKAHEAMQMAENYLKRAAVITVQSYQDRMSFERWVADVWIDGVSLADQMKMSGIVK